MTIKKGQPIALSFSASTASSAPIGAVPSINMTVRSASLIERVVRSIPICSTTSEVSRTPAVSISITGMPLTSTGSSILSLVVPGMSVTIALSKLSRRLSKLDLPAFGLPTMASFRPSRKNLPERAVLASTLTRLKHSLVTFSISVKSSSPTSSGKSMPAIILVSSSTSRARTALISSPR